MKWKIFTILGIIVTAMLFVTLASIWDDLNKRVVSQIITLPKIIITPENSK